MQKTNLCKRLPQDYATKYRQQIFQEDGLIDNLQNLFQLFYRLKVLVELFCDFLTTLQQVPYNDCFWLTCELSSRELADHSITLFDFRELKKPCLWLIGD